MPQEIIKGAGVTEPRSAYSQGVAANGLIFIAGQVALDGDGEVVGVDDLAAQTRQVVANLETVLRAGGASLADVVSTTVYLKTFDEYAEYDRVYAECFGTHRPARATVQAELLMPKLLVEIQAIAVRA